MVPEAPLTRTEAGLVPSGDGWFVLNAREAHWRDRPGRGMSLPFEGPTEFPQVGVNLFVLGPGEPIGMYHCEAVQEDFLVLSGEGLLLVEGEERPLRPWDFVHCPAGTAHMILGAGERPCVVLAVGAREHRPELEWGRYILDEAALRHGAGVEVETADAETAYARFADAVPTRYRDGSLPFGGIDRDETERIRELVRHVVEECWSSGAALGKMEALVAPGYVHHSAFGDMPFDGFRRGLAWVETQLVERSYRVEHVVVEGDLAAAAIGWRARRVSDGSEVHGRGAYHCRVRDGLIVEDWDVFFPME